MTKPVILASNPILDLDDHLLTIKEVRAILRIGRTKTWELLASGRLQAVRLGSRCTRVKASSVRALMNE